MVCCCRLVSVVTAFEPNVVGRSHERRRRHQPAGPDGRRRIRPRAPGGASHGPRPGAGEAGVHRDRPGPRHQGDTEGVTVSVWAREWEFACCGGPFTVGDTVTWRI